MSASNALPIVTITGTKGKTTTTSVVSRLLYNLGKRTLHVTTSGHYVNGHQRSTINDSKNIWDLKTPSLVPGRYLADFLSDDLSRQNSVAILEASFSCYKAGLGYGRHKVGVFLNVYEDHIDEQSRIRNRQDLARAKSFIFSKIARDGWAVFNADDQYVISVLDAIPKDYNIRLIPCARDFSNYNIEAHLSDGGVAIKITDQAIMLISDGKSDVLYKFRDNDMTYNGIFLPAIWNLAHACGAVYGLYDGHLPPDFQAAVHALPLGYDDGRMSLMENDDGVIVLADYAHEKESLRAVADFARNYVDQKSGRLIGVVRLNHERPDRVLYEFGELAGSIFDEVIVYDKIDGYWRNAKPSRIKRYVEEVGRTSTIVHKGTMKTNPSSRRILREDDAITYTAQQARKGDVVVIIVNDDTKRSLNFIKKSFKLDSSHSAPQA